MSRHKIVKNMDLDDELDDYDGGEDYDYDGSSDNGLYSLSGASFLFYTSFATNFNAWFHYRAHRR